MKYLICGDVHWSQYSSIVRKRTDRFSVRLENLIKSVSWVEGQATANKVEKIIYLGDFFDKPELNAEEISALKHIVWSNIPKTFIVGNHEISTSDNSFNSSSLFDLIPNIETISQPYHSIPASYMPYKLYEDITTLQEMLNIKEANKSGRILFSHNDLKGYHYGPFISDVGLDMEEVDSLFEICFNGHLHNGGRHKNIVNVGNLTGQNFSEDAYRYSHNIYIYDTDTKELQEIENPFAFNFYKIDIDFYDLNDIEKLEHLKDNAVISVQCDARDYERVRSVIESNPNIIESRVTIKSVLKEELADTDNVASPSCDHLQQFSEFIYENLGKNDIIDFELNEVLK